MSIGFEMRNAGASLVSLEEVDPKAKPGKHLDWVEFVRTHDGAIPCANEFDLVPVGKCGIQEFLGVRQVQATKRILRGRMPDEMLPVAAAEGGNYVCLDVSSDGAGVCFWDHETEEVTPLAPSFSDFLALLRPFDPDSVVLNPEDVISVWVDPSLFERD